MHAHVLVNAHVVKPDSFSFINKSRYIDMAETLCQKRALEAFQLDPAKWGGNGAKHIIYMLQCRLFSFHSVKLTLSLFCSPKLIFRKFELIASVLQVQPFDLFIKRYYVVV